MPESAAVFAPQVDSQTAINVMRAVLGSESCTPLGPIEILPLAGVHHDSRTVGIVRVVGNAQCGPDQRSWSAVLKVIDRQAEAKSHSRWPSTEREHLVYELGVFQESDIPFRAAKSYGTESPENDGLTYMWMEDLTDAPSPPWTLEQYLTTAYNVGRFNGHHAIDPTETTRLDLPSRQFAVRYADAELNKWFGDLWIYSDSEEVRAVYSPDLLMVAWRLDNTRDAVISAARSLPVSLAHGDCHARNLFLVEETTVAIDWPCLALEPLGADLGMLISSGLIWGLEEYLLLVGNDRALFGEYMRGLGDSGWDGHTEAVRLGFYAQFVVNLSRTATAIGRLMADPSEAMKAGFETRTGTKYKDMPALFAKIVEHIPPYVDEIEALLASYGR